MNTPWAVTTDSLGRRGQDAGLGRPGEQLGQGGQQRLDVIRLQVRHSDFTTSAHIVAAVNKKFESAAHAENGGLVSIAIPAEYSSRTTEFISELVEQGEAKEDKRIDEQYYRRNPESF